MEHPGSIGHQDHAKDVRLAPESVDQGVAPKYLHWAGIFGSFWWVKTRINHPELDGLYMFIPSGYIHLLRFYGSSSSLILGNQVGWMGRLLFRWPASSEILLPPAIHNMKNPGWGQLQVAMIGDVEKNNKTLALGIILRQAEDEGPKGDYNIYIYITLIWYMCIIYI